MVRSIIYTVIAWWKQISVSVLWSGFKSLSEQLTGVIHPFALAQQIWDILHCLYVISYSLISVALLKFRNMFIDTHKHSLSLMSSVKNVWSWFISCILFLWFFLLWKTFKVCLLMNALHEVLQFSENSFLSFFLSHLRAVLCIIASQFCRHIHDSCLPLDSWFWHPCRCFNTSLCALPAHGKQSIWLESFFERFIIWIPCRFYIAHKSSMRKRTEMNVESNSSFSCYLLFKTNFNMYAFLALMCWFWMIHY